MAQFSTNKDAFGNVTAETGAVIDISQSTTFYKYIGNTETAAVLVDPVSNTARFAPRFAGGSGRNILIRNNVVPGSTPYGWMFPDASESWLAEDGVFYASVNGSGEIEFSDDTDIIAVSDPYPFPTSGYNIGAANQTYGWGGTFPPGGGPGTRTITLGSGIGEVAFKSDGFISGASTFRFEVVWNGTTVIDTGSLASGSSFSHSFIKTTASPATISVTLTSASTTGSGYVEIGSNEVRTDFTADSTSYGDGLNGGTPFTLNCTYENGGGEITAEVTSNTLFGDDDPVVFTQSKYDWQNWTDPTSTYFVNIDATGLASISDATDVIAERVELLNLDPTGSYVATTYGKTTYNVDEDFDISILPIEKNSQTLVTYLAMDVTGTVLDDVRGPFSDPALPANTSTVKYLPISTSDVTTGVITQLLEGTLVLR